MKEINAKEYFDSIKDKKIKTTDEDLKKYYSNAEKLLQKAVISGQIEAMKKLVFHIDTIEKERQLIKLGIDTFIYKDDIEEFIDNVSKNTVKIIELERYEREIPDEAVDAISKTKHLFDKFYVVFTDYTGKVEKQALKERKEKDPILFGVFQDEKNRIIVDRFYYVADWEDEYCDLTLDKMISQMQESGKDIERKISTPIDLDSIREQLNQLEPKNNIYVMKDNSTVKKETFFSKVKTFFKKD